MTLRHRLVDSRRFKTPSTGLKSYGWNVPELFSETSTYSLDYQIKGEEVETAGHTPVSEEKSTQVLVRKPEGKIAIFVEEDAVMCVEELA